MSIRRSAGVSVSPGVVASYIHNATGPDLGKIGVLVALESSGDAAKAGGSRQADRDAYRGRLPDRAERGRCAGRVVARERAIFADQARESGKPANVIEKMVEGRLRKFYEEQVLLSADLRDRWRDARSSKVLENASKELGAKVQIKSFLRFQVGEGIDKPTTDFADEVKRTAGGH